jgi:PKHD-type hydroxylase
MAYNKIINNPIERTMISYPWSYWDGAFNAEELDKVCKYFTEQGVERGTTVGKKDSITGETIQEPNEKVRISDVKFHFYDPTNENTLWIFQRINYVVESLNEQFFNYELNGYDAFQYTEYQAHEGGKYDFHMDTIMGKNKPANMPETRKLSVTLVLNDDFEGGEFYMNNGQEKDAELIPTGKGRLILFPSFLIHRVAPVTKGVRKSLVVWVNGPKFR